MDLVHGILGAKSGQEPRVAEGCKKKAPRKQGGSLEWKKETKQDQAMEVRQPE